MLSQEEIEQRLSKCDPENRWWLEPYLRGETDLDGAPLNPTEEHLS
jgi:hypothetical protein